MTEQIYHILVTRTCDHKCPVCCNKFYDLDKLPAVTPDNLREAHTVCLTGGEPLLLGYEQLYNLARRIRTQYPNIKKLYVYTSGQRLKKIQEFTWCDLCRYIDGLSVSPKSLSEWVAFAEFSSNKIFSEISTSIKMSNRLYVFDEQLTNWELVKNSYHINLDSSWDVIGRKWDKTFKTPENEHFVRLPILY